MRIKVLICFQLTILSLSLNSCSAQNKLGESRNDIVEDIIAESSEGVYYKTFSSEDIHNLNIDLQDLNFWNPCKYKLEEKDSRLKQEEVDYLNKQWKGLKSVKLKSDLPKLKRKRKPDDTRLTTITLPITFRNGNYAVYYSEQRYGGQINLLKKEDEKWIIYCSYMVWIE